MFRRGWLRATLLLSAPGAWFVLIYLDGARDPVRVGLLDASTRSPAKIVHNWNLDNFQTIVESPTYRHDRAAHDRDRRAR